MQNPLISIVIPVYNVEEYLEVSIDSVLNQDYVNLEVILVDDGSTDHSPQICDSYADSNDNVKVVHKENAGQGEARNSGLDIARGEYIFFLDSDDTIQRNTLSLFVDFINHHGEMSIVGLGFQNVDVNNRMAPAIISGSDIAFDYVHEAQNRFLLRSLVILAPGTFYNVGWMKRNHLRFKKVPYSEDQLFVLLTQPYTTIFNAPVLSCGQRSLRKLSQPILISNPFRNSFQSNATSTPRRVNSCCRVGW